jgi:hypothetical protein
MSDLVLLLGAVVLLGLLYGLCQRQRERALLKQLQAAAREPSAVLSAMDLAIAEDARREAFWREQDPR